MLKYLDMFYSISNEMSQHDVLQEFEEDSSRAENTLLFRAGMRDRANTRITASIISVFKSRSLSHSVIESFVEITSGFVWRLGEAASQERLFFSPRVI